MIREEGKEEGTMDGKVHEGKEGEGHCFVMRARQL